MTSKSIKQRSEFLSEPHRPRIVFVRTAAELNHYTVRQSLEEPTCLTEVLYLIKCTFSRLFPERLRFPYLLPNKEPLPLKG